MLKSPGLIPSSRQLSSSHLIQFFLENIQHISKPKANQKASAQLMGQYDSEVTRECGPSWTDMIVRYNIMIQQSDSPLLYTEHSESKYRKALAEIHKIHSANKVLKAETESIKMQSDQRVRELTQSLEQMQERSQRAEREIMRLREENARQDKTVQDLLSSCANLKLQKSRLTQEIAFLTNTITEQGIELKKVSALKGDKNVTILVASYEEREHSYRSQIARQEELVVSLEKSVKVVEEQLKSERRKTWQLAESNNMLRAEVQKYKETNASLLSRYESLLSTAISGRKSQEKDKYRQAGAILSEMGRQLDLIRTTRAQQEKQRRPISKENDTLVIQNQKLSQELQRTRTRLKEIEEKSRQSLQLQQKLKLTSLKMEYMQEQCNTLKRKLVVLETSQSINEENDQWLKNIKEKPVQYEADKANYGKSPDISQFQLMKAYIIQAKRRLSQALLDKKQIQKKYRAMKEKYADRAQRVLQLEEQQRLLHSKLDGFQKLAERLQFQLERSMHANQEEITQIKTSTRAVSDKKVQQADSKIVELQIQLERQRQIFQRTEEELRNEINALEQELSNQKSRGKDIHFQLEQVNEFLAIYKDKFEQLQAHNQELEETHTVLSQNALRFEQLYRQQRVKNDVLAAQKQSLTAKLTRVNEQIDRRQQEDAESMQREAAYEYQLTKLRNQLQQVRSQATQLHNTLKAASNQVEESRLTISGAARSEGGYHSSLEHNYQKQRQRNKLLESELATLKQKLDQTILQAQRAASLQDALSAKSQELSDIKRRTAGFDKEVGFLESQMRRIRSEYQNLKKENGILKNKLMEGSQEMRKSVAARETEGEKYSQRMSEELVSTSAQLRQERRKTARLQLELQAISGELRRAEQLLEQSLKKEKALAEQLITLRSAYNSACQENIRVKSQINYEKSIQEGLKNDVQAAQSRIKQLRQQNQGLSLKLQSLELRFSDFTRQLGGLKVYLPEIQNMAIIKSNSSWQQQREKENLTNFIQRIKKLLKSTLSSDEMRPEQYRIQAISPSKISSLQPEYLRHHEKATFGAEPASENLPEPSFSGDVDHEELTSQYHDYLQ